jgi:hypothetical protein
VQAQSPHFRALSLKFVWTCADKAEKAQQNRPASLRNRALFAGRPRKAAENAARPLFRAQAGQFLLADRLVVGHLCVPKQ